jgi:hypothetical protein
VSAYDNDPRVSAKGTDFWVTISHGQYLVEHDDRDGLWWAFDESGIRIGTTAGGRDPLACSSDACAGWDTADDLIRVLLSFDGQQVPR